MFELILLAALLAASAFFSGSETALFSLSRYELSRLRQGGGRGARMVADLMQHPRRLLLTLMIGNVSVNMFIFATGFVLFQRLAGGYAWLGALLGLVTPVLLTLFGEILPKSTALALRIRFAVTAAPAIRVVQLVLDPISRALLYGLVEPLTRLLTGARPPDDYVTTEELGELIEVSQRHRIIDADETAMLGEVIRLNEMHVYDIMVPRVDMIAFDINDGPAKLRQMMREHGFKKIPAYDGEIDRIVGLVYANDVFLNPAREPATLVRPVRFMPEIIRLTQLLQHFRRTGTALAIAVDEMGAVAGLVTLTDVAAEIVGDLLPGEDADARPLWERIDATHYRVAGRINIHDWAEQFNFQRPEESVTTLAGLIMVRLGRPPVQGDEVHLGNLLLTVESVQGRRVESVLLELLPQAAAPAAGGPRS